MQFTIGTPALLFSAISLLLLAYTNRFLAIASLTRAAIKNYQDDRNDNGLRQIRHFKKRLRLIKHTQVFAVLSFLLCVVSMLSIMMGAPLAGKAIFAGSLIVMMASLITSLVEVMISINGLNLELEKIEE